MTKEKKNHNNIFHFSLCNFSIHLGQKFFLFFIKSHGQALAHKLAFGLVIPMSFIRFG